MRIPKRYGESKKQDCPFCGKLAITKNPQGIPVCFAHKNTKLDDVKCVCGKWLELRSGKFGPYFNCINCGNINWNRGLEMNSSRVLEKKQEEKKRPKEITITSDEVDWIFG